MVKFVGISFFEIWTQADFVFMIQRIHLYCLGSTEEINLHLPVSAQMYKYMYISE